VSADRDDLVPGPDPGPIGGAARRHRDHARVTQRHPRLGHLSRLLDLEDLPGEGRGRECGE
jgi:hypothetical protein